MRWFANYMAHGAFLLLGLLFTLTSQPVHAQEVPEALQPWSGWVLHGQEQKLCPVEQGGATTLCVWPGTLTLAVDGKGGRFDLAAELFAPAWLPLPGNAKIWPQQVRSSNKPLPVVERNGHPQVFLPAGLHRVRGNFSWSSMPDLLPLPDSLALIELTLKGRQVALPDRDERGHLWLTQRRRSTGNEQQELLQVTVFRRLIDEVPFQVETRIELQVSGKPREELLGGGVLSTGVALRLDSPLPARVESDGRVRVQLRPGTWVLELRSRFPVPPASLAIARSNGAWSDTEIWVFDARPNLRLVDLSGVSLVDPQQTRLPDNWRQLPAYQMSGDATLTFTEKRRGASGQLHDRLNLHRTLWLDFDGGGYTLQDRVEGSMGSSWRLEMPSPGILGRVAIDGVDQFITRNGEQGFAGVEVRGGQLNLTADSRWQGERSTLPAVGWKAVFQKVTATLNLPPGWVLLDISGADHAPGTWLKRWSLLDLFLVLLVAIGAFRLWGWRWGGVALVAIGLAWHEGGAPRWVWLHLLAAAALIRVLPSGKARLWVTWYRSLTYLVLVGLALVFMVSQVRLGLYPQLAKPGGMARPVVQKRAPVAPQILSESEVREERLADQVEQAPRRMKSSSVLLPSLSRSVEPREPQLQLQTGPGVPQWRWQRVEIAWNGPVTPDQRLRLLLLPPWVSLLLCLLRVALVGLLIWRVLDLEEPQGGWRSWLRPGGVASAVVVIMFMLVPAPSARAEFPSEKLLKQLEKRLLEAPECGNRCASIGRMHLSVDQREMRLRLLLDAQAQIAVPLPGQSLQWRAEEVVVDGQPAQALRRDEHGGLWLVVSAGRHQVVLRGTAPRANSLLLPLPLQPHRVSWQADGWKLEGVDGQGVPSGQLQLQRDEPRTTAASDELEPSQIPPFFRIERTLQLGLKWQVMTRVTRLSPRDQPVALDFPLLSGEAPIDELPVVKSGVVRVVLPAGVSERTWFSYLEVQPQLTLQAPQEGPWVESWKLDLSPLWHVEFGGIPRTYPEQPGTSYLPEWRPWPGEQVSLNLTRPLGVDGQTLTVDAARLSLVAGAGSSEATLKLELRSSQGGQHQLMLPEGAELLRVIVDGREQPVRREEAAVFLPIHPGKQHVELVMRLAEGMGVFWKSPTLQLGAGSVNSRLDVKIPSNRWVLFAGGPSMGPAVLFWGVMLIVVAAGFVLARFQLAPLRSWEWILLGIGLSQGHVVLSLLVVGWLLALGWRRRLNVKIRAELFNLTQVGLVLLTVLALGSLCWAVQFGLLGYPDMQIAGNGSSSQMLRWYQDLSPLDFPRAWVVSLPMLVYRLFMLAWSLWLAFALLRWLTWGWEGFSSHGLWRHKLRKGKFRFLSADGKDLEGQEPTD